MAEENQERQSPLMRRPQVVRGLIGAGIIGTYALLGFFLAPWFIERTLVSTLADRLNLETRVGELSLNPFTLAFAADDLEIIDIDGSQLFAFERLFVNFQLSSLFRWAWSFDEIHLIRPRLSLQRFSDSETNFSRLGERWADSAAPAEPQQPSADGAALPRFVAADLRIIEGYVAISDQVPAEQFDTSLSPINLAVRNFSTLPEKNGEQQVTISTESGATVAWTGHLSVNPLAVTGRVTVEGTYTPLLFRYFQDQLALPISFEGGELQASLNYQVNMDQAGQLSIRIDSLEGTLADLHILQPDQPHLVELGLLAVSGGTFAWPELAVHLDRVQFDEVLIQPFLYPHGGYFPNQSNPAVTSPAPEDELENKPGDEPETVVPMNTVAEDTARWKFSVDSVELSNWRLLHTETELAGAVLEISSLDLILGQLTNDPGQQMPLDINARLGTGGTVAVNGQVQAMPEFNLEAAVTGSDLALVALQPYLNALAHVKIARGHVNLNGAITSNGENPFRYRGDFRIQDLELIDRVQEESLLSWKALTVDRLDLTPTALELSVLSLDAPYARIEIEQDGSTNIERTMIAAESAETEASVSTTDAAPGFALTVGETRITQGGANFTDLALPLPFEAKISELSGTLSTLATTSREPVHIDLAGQVNEFGQVQVNGNLSAYQPSAATDLSVDFENVNLPQVTPYTIKFAGRKIDDGRMDLALNYKLDEGALDGSNRLVVRQLQLGEKVDQPGAMDLPLDMAVGLLKGPDGTLDFSFPVSGRLDDPEFSYAGAVSKAFSNVILGLATAPFRLLGSLVGLKAEELDHIGFKPGQAELTPPQKEVMQKLTEALGQRPQLLLEAAPVSSPAADRAAIAVAMVDAEIGQRLEQHPDPDALITEQRRQVLEALYDESGLQPGRREIEATHQAAADAQTPGLDVPAYLADLRQALIDSREVADTDINLLARRRLDAVQRALTESAGLPAERLSALPAEAVDLNDKGLVQMSLKVTIAD